jgi:hypothetical protein
MSSQEDASRIYLGGFMQNQLPVVHVEITDRFAHYGNGADSFRTVHFEEPYQPETKVGAIPANFFFSL